MSALPQQSPQAYPSPSTTYDLDQSPMQFGPNLAADQDFSRVVLDHLWRNFVYPQVLQQEQLWPVWQRIDDAFRVKGQSIDLDISAADTQFVNKNADGKGRGGLTDRYDGYSSRVFPATLHKQIVTKTDMHMSIAWSDGLPVRATKRSSQYEHPLYNPIEQSVEACNIELQRCARVINLKKIDRKGRGSLAKYGHAWATVDFRFSMEDKPMSFPVPPDPQLAQAMMMDLTQQFGGQPQVTRTPFGLMATWNQKAIKQMETAFEPQRVDNVFIDQTLPAYDMEAQMCPCVRTRINPSQIRENDYDPVNNPFGYLNVQLALSKGVPQWSTGPSDTIFQEELQKKWGLSMFGQIRPKNAIKQKWVMYPKLGIYQDPKTQALMLDDGNGITCPQCQGKGHLGPLATISLDPMGHPMGSAPSSHSNDCPMCDGTGTYFVPLQRFVVECFGNLEYQNSSAVALRIQPIATPNKKVPILFTANLSEDTSGAIPLAKTEASMKAVQQEATCFNQFFDAKNKAINPSMLIPEDADDRLDYGQHGKNFKTDYPEKFQPLGPKIDATQNMMPFMERMQSDIMEINGMSPQLLGIVSSGRRPATELQNAFDASKMPITIEIDQYNEDMLGQWATWHLANIQAYAPREEIWKLTGRTMVPEVDIFSQVADEYMKRQAAIGNIQFLGQWLSNRPDANIAPLVTAFAKLTKVDQWVNADEVMPDGGMKKARADGMRIVTEILGEGKPLQATPSDPHAIYIEIFEQALQDPYWQEHTPETLPILGQRLQQQLFFQQQQLQAQMMAQQHQLVMAHVGKAVGMASQPQRPQGNGNQPAMSNQAPATSGGANQQMMGANS